MWVAVLAVGCAPPASDPPPAPEPVPEHAPEPAPPPPSEARVTDAIGGAVRFLDSQTRSPGPSLRVDVLIGLAGVRRFTPRAEVDALLARVTPLADSGGDPRRRLWDDAARLPPEVGYTWTPEPGKFVTPNFALVEALYCAERPLRPEAVAWTCATLRDEGGRLSGHAAWILHEAVERGCLPRAATCLDVLRDELAAAAAVPRPLPDSDARDLLGEQILFGLQAGVPRAALVPAVEALLAAQGPDGSFGTPGDTSFTATHATLVGAWALATWVHAP